MKKLLNFFVTVVLLVFCLGVSAKDGDPFEISGEQLLFRRSPQWDLVWMARNPDEGYFIEYVPSYEHISNWKFGYQKVQRYPMPSSEAIGQVLQETNSVSLLEGLSKIHQSQAKQACQGEYRPLPLVRDKVNSMDFVRGGGFCTKYGGPAAFGEGAIIAFYLGKDYVHSVHYGWRPIDLKSQQENSPYGVFLPLLGNHLKSLSMVSVCGSQDKSMPSCPSNYPAGYEETEFGKNLRK